MDRNRWKQIDEIIDTVLDLDQRKREAFLSEACAGDQDLRNEVERLLAADAEENSMMEGSAMHMAGEFAQRSDSRLSPGDSIGPYKILHLLGAGGMGEVYRATDGRLDRDVAIKVLLEDTKINSKALIRFQRETKALAALSHPNIIAIYDVGNHDGLAFAVMELLKGETLRSYLARETFTWEKAVFVGSRIADGLFAAHSQGVIHRDLKPENIFLTSDGAVKILDFGLVRRKRLVSLGDTTSAATESHETQPGILMGTFPYMSPEQLRGLPIDARSDLFSFGTMLYEMVTGVRPFSGENAADLTAAILKEEPFPFSVNCPLALQQLILKCLKKDREERFQRADDLALELKTLISAPTSTGPFSQPVPHQPIYRRKLLWATAGFLATIIALFLLAPWNSKSIHSVAVLPFLNASQNLNDDYLIDGVTEHIIDTLSQLPELRVMARGTVFTYKGKQMDPRTVGRDLKVDAVVTGRILRKGDDLMMSADLVNVADGAQIWGKKFNRPISDLLLMQSELSREISNKLQGNLTAEQQKLVSKHYTENPEAYQYYLRGRYHWLKDTPHDYKIARDYFEKAIQKDPSYARAYIALAGYYVTLGMYGMEPPKEQWAKSLAAMNRARVLDPRLVEAHLGDAEFQFYHEWNWARAEQAIKRGLQLSPGDPDLHQFYSKFLRAMGRWDEAIAAAKRSQELDPLTLLQNKSLGTTYLWAKQYDNALIQFRKTEELDPNYAGIHDALADAYKQKGMHQEAINELGKYLKALGDEEGGDALIHEFSESGYEAAIQSLYEIQLEALTESAKETYVSPMFFVFIYSHLNRKEHAFEWLEKAYQERSSWLVFLKTDPQFDNLRSDPRFRKMLEKVGLPL